MDTDNETPMTNAEFKCLREKLGLTTNWLSKRWNVADNTVKRWERNREIPVLLADDLRDLLGEFDASVAEACATCGPGVAMIVPRIDAETTDGRPATWHHAIAQAVSEETGCRILFLDDEQL